MPKKVTGITPRDPIKTKKYSIFKAYQEKYICVWMNVCVCVYVRPRSEVSKLKPYCNYGVNQISFANHINNR